MVIIHSAVVEKPGADILPPGDRGLGAPDVTDEQRLDAIEQRPALLNRPIVVTPKGVRLCRPAELALDLLPPQRGEFFKENGERVVDGQGRQVATG